MTQKQPNKMPHIHFILPLSVSLTKLFSIIFGYIDEKTPLKGWLSNCSQYLKRILICLMLDIIISIGALVCSKLFTIKSETIYSFKNKLLFKIALFRQEIICALWGGFITQQNLLPSVLWTGALQFITHLLARVWSQVLWKALNSNNLTRKL